MTPESRPWSLDFSLAAVALFMEIRMSICSGFTFDQLLLLTKAGCQGPVF